ncbi:hypothetical protein, partial [Kitasatospora herbaricolor]|uniref:hypothetical protein n=1 Tax=Kitasatospora herbaricolor TaxID=68217 RepID=UPI0036DE29FC
VRSLGSSTPGTKSENTGTGLIVLNSTDSLTLVDGTTGATRWTADMARCGFTATVSGTAPRVDAGLDDVHDTLVLVQDLKTSTFSASTGAAHPVPDLPAAMWLLLGPSNSYALSSGATSSLHAYDRESGRSLGSVTKARNGSWYFAGGYLVFWSGTRLDSVG